jgi:hypothetical protein
LIFSKLQRTLKSALQKKAQPEGYVTEKFVVLQNKNHSLKAMLQI